MSDRRGATSRAVRRRPSFASALARALARACAGLSWAGLAVFMGRSSGPRGVDGAAGAPLSLLHKFPDIHAQARGELAQHRDRRVMRAQLNPRDGISAY